MYRALKRDIAEAKRSKPHAEACVCVCACKLVRLSRYLFVSEAAFFSLEVQIWSNHNVKCGR